MLGSDYDYEQSMSSVLCSRTLTPAKFAGQWHSTRLVVFGFRDKHTLIIKVFGLRDCV